MKKGAQQGARSPGLDLRQLPTTMQIGMIVARVIPLGKHVMWHVTHSDSKKDSPENISSGSIDSRLSKSVLCAAPRQ